MSRTQRSRFITASLLAATVAATIAPVARAATDNFDSYSVGSSLFGLTNGQMTYVNSHPVNTPIQNADHVIVTSSSSVSAPNAIEFTDPDADGGGFTIQLDPSQAVNLTPLGAKAQISFDMKATNGYEGRVTLQNLGLFSLDANGTSQDWIDNNHYFTLTDSGLFSLNNGTVIGGLANRWQSNEWYRVKLEITHSSAVVDAEMTYTASIVRPSDNAVLDTQSASGLRAADRFYLTGLAMALSSNLDEVLLLDNLKITAPGPGWAVDSAGDWHGAGNWVGGVPNGVDAVARFGDAISATRTVYADSPATVGAMVFDSLQTYNVTGGSSLTIDVSSGSGSIAVLQGVQKINLPLFVNDNTTADVSAGATLKISNPMTLVGGSTLTKLGDGTLSIEAPVTNSAAAVLALIAGNTNLLMDAGSNTSISVTGGTTSFRATQHLASLSVSGGVATVSTPGAVLKTTSLSVSGSGSMDLGSGRLIVDYSGPTPANDLRSAITSGKLTSSDLTANMAIGYAEATDLFTSFPASFSGETIDNTTLLARATVLADASLDGVVNSNDFNLLVASYGTASNARWSQGDFDYNGKVNSLDFNLLAGHFGQSVAAPALSAVVPEPASAVMLIALLPLRKRR